MSKFHAAMQRVEELEASPPFPSIEPPPSNDATETTSLRVIPSPGLGADDEPAKIDTIVSVVAGGECGGSGEASTDSSPEAPDANGVEALERPTAEEPPSPAQEAEDFWRRAWERSTPAPYSSAAGSDLSRPAEGEPAPGPEAEPADEDRGWWPVSVRIGAGKAPRAAAPRRVELVAPNLDSFVAAYGPCVSKGGMFVAARSPFRSGTPVEVYVRLESGETLLRSSGAVEWSRSEAPGMAVRFVDLDEKSLAFVESVVSRHIERGGVPFDIHRGGPTPERLPSSPSRPQVEEGVEPADASPPEESPADAPLADTPPSGESSDAPSDADSSAASSRPPSLPAEKRHHAGRTGEERPPVRVAKRNGKASRPTAASSEYEKIVKKLLAARGKAGHRVFLIASATPRGGASTLARNLATALASDESRRVVLVDGNLRAPTQHLKARTLQLDGLAEALQGDVSLGAALKQPNRSPYTLLSSGRPPENPAYFFSHSPLDELVSQLRDEFDWVIIDGPPLNSFPEAAILAQASDAALLVLEAERTRWEVAEEAKAILDSSGVEVLGTVLNRQKHHVPGFLYRHL